MKMCKQLVEDIQIEQEQEFESINTYEPELEL